MLKGVAGSSRDPIGLGRWLHEAALSRGTTRSVNIVASAAPAVSRVAGCRFPGRKKSRVEHLDGGLDLGSWRTLEETIGRSGGGRDGSPMQLSAAVAAQL